MKRILRLAMACLLIAKAGAETPVREVPAFGTHFASRGLTGTVVILDPQAKEILAWNPDRAKERFIPASTFKIANALIGLESGAVKSLERGPALRRQTADDAGMGKGSLLA